MEISKTSMVELAQLVATAVVEALEAKGVIGTQPTAKPTKSAYQKTEQLLYNYNGFKRIIRDKKQEIADIRRYGVPQRCGSSGERVQTSRVQTGLMTVEESVEAAVRTVEASVEGTVQAVALIDKCMASLANDPYYKVLEMRYFEGNTLEYIGVYFNCDHTTISRNKNRLVKELSMRLFPDEVIKEMM